MLTNFYTWYVNELNALCEGIDILWLGVIVSVFLILLFLSFSLIKKIVANFENSLLVYFNVIFLDSIILISISFLFFGYIIETSTLNNYHFAEIFFYWVLVCHFFWSINIVLGNHVKLKYFEKEDKGFLYLLNYTRIYILYDKIGLILGSFGLLIFSLIIPLEFIPLSIAYMLWVLHWIYTSHYTIKNISKKIELEKYITEKLIKNQNPTFWDYTSIEYINSIRWNILFLKLKYIIWHSSILLILLNSDLIILELKFFISILYTYAQLINFFKFSVFSNLESNSRISKIFIDNHKLIYIDYLLISIIICIIYQTYYIEFNNTLNCILLIIIGLYLCKDLLGYVILNFFNKWLSKTIDSDKINLIFVSESRTKNNKNLSSSIIENMGVIPYKNWNAFIYNKSKIELDHEGHPYKIEESINDSRHYIIINSNDDLTESVYYQRDVFLISNMLRNTTATFDIFSGDLFETNELFDQWQYFGSRKIGKKKYNESIKLSDEDEIYIKNVSDINLRFMLTMCDEKEIEVIDFNGIFENLTYENHKINDLLFSHLKSENKELIPFINEDMKYSIFEISLLYRQFFELGDLASKFMALLDIAECILMYMLGIVTGKDENNNFYWNNIDENNLKNISFGGAIKLLETWTNEYKEINPVHNKLHKELTNKFENKEILKKLAVLVKDSLSVGDGSIKTYKTNLSIFYFISAIRNKTRGHGAPTKASFELVNLTFKLITIMFYSFNKIPGRLYCRTSFEGVDFNVDLNYGPCPRIFHASEDTINKHDSTEIVNEKKDRDEFFEKCKVPSNFIEPIWCFENENKFDFFSIGEIVKINEGRTYLLSSKEKNKSTFVSHSTGDIIKPSYKKFDN